MKNWKVLIIIVVIDIKILSETRFPGSILKYFITSTKIILSSADIIVTITEQHNPLKKVDLYTNIDIIGPIDINNNDFIHTIDGKYIVIILFTINNNSKIHVEKENLLILNLKLYLSII